MRHRLVLFLLETGIVDQNIIQKEGCKTHGAFKVPTSRLDSHTRVYLSLSHSVFSPFTLSDVLLISLISQLHFRYVLCCNHVQDLFAIPRD